MKEYRGTPMAESELRLIYHMSNATNIVNAHYVAQLVANAIEADQAKVANPYRVVATVLNSMGAVLAGSTDPEASWTEDDVQQCVEAVQ